MKCKTLSQLQPPPSDPLRLPDLDGCYKLLIEIIKQARQETEDDSLPEYSRRKARIFVKWAEEELGELCR